MLHLVSENVRGRNNTFVQPFYLLSFSPSFYLTAGICAFLAHLGLQSAEGIGAVVGDIATAVTLGGCPPEQQTKLVAYVTMPVHLTAPVSKATNTLAMSKVAS